MGLITRTIIKKQVAHDCEARYYDWEVADRFHTYEEAAEDLRQHQNAWYTGIAEVQQVFDPENFEITDIFLRKMRREYNWDKGKYELEETIYEDGE